MDASPIVDAAVILVGNASVWAALRRDQRRTRAIVNAIASHLGLKVSDGIHVEPRTPSQGHSIIPRKGIIMRRLLPLLVLIAAVALCCFTAAHGYSDDGANAAAVKDAVTNGVSQAAPAAFAGNWFAAICGFLTGAVPGLFAVLSHQAQTKWNLFHASNAVEAAKASAK